MLLEREWFQTAVSQRFHVLYNTPLRDILSIFLKQWFPPVVPGPLGSETSFSGIRNAIFDGESLYVLGCKNQDL